MLVAAAVTLNIGWILVNGRRLAPLVLGVITFALIIAGLIVYTVFLVREMGITEQQDSFLNSVTHELKTPIASIRLYLETLQSREVGDAQRKEFYRIMLQDADRLQHTVEQVLRAGHARQKRKLDHRAPVDLVWLVQDCIDIARMRHHLPATAIVLAEYDPTTRTAEITLRYTGELTSLVRNKAGEIIEGSATEVKRQRDGWTFARRMGVQDPNWQLVGTSD